MLRQNIIRLSVVAFSFWHEFSSAQWAVGVLEFVDVSVDPLEDARLVEQVTALRNHASRLVIIRGEVFESANANSTVFSFELHLLQVTTGLDHQRLLNIIKHPLLGCF